jgi:hypothetical protein
MRFPVGGFLFVACLFWGISLQALAATPQTNYILRCMGCHLQDGSATPGHIPGLNGIDRFLSVEGGREYLIRVPGVSLSVLDDQDLTDLMNWLLVRFGTTGTGADFIPYTPIEVAAYRRLPYTGVDAVRLALITAIESQD